MAALYVAYSAKLHDGTGTGWIVLDNRAEPQCTGDIQSICKRIAEVESAEKVIPLWWKALDRAR